MSRLPFVNFAKASLASAGLYAAPGGGMQLIFMPGDTKLFATGSGGGFHRGVPEVAVPQTEQNPTCRFPASPPLVPENP